MKEKEIKVQNSYINMKIDSERFINILKRLKKKTGAHSFESAMELIFFRCSQSEMEDISMLVTLLRCSRDGCVKPPIDIEKLYTTLPP